MFRQISPECFIKSILLSIFFRYYLEKKTFKIPEKSDRKNYRFLPEHHFHQIFLPNGKQKEIENNKNR